jgi:hypothetical protein
MSRFTQLFFLSLCFICGPSWASGYFATQLTSDNIQGLPAGGLDAIGGIGDWFITNGNLCAVVSGKGHSTYLSLDGGALVDLWHCALANDQWSVTHTQLNLQKDEIPAVQSIVAGFDMTRAWVETRGARDGLENTIRYQLSAAAPEKIEIVTNINRTSDGPRLGMVGTITLHPRASLIPFSVNTRDTGKSPGFNVPEVDTSNPLSILSSVSSSDLQILMGSRHIRPSISYAVHAPRAELQDDKGGATALNNFMLNGREFTMFGFFSRPFPSFWAEEPGLVSFGIGQLFDLGIDERLLVRQTIAVSREADAAYFTDKAFNGTTIKGKVDSGASGITIFSAAGKPLTFTRSNSTGDFSFRLPLDVSAYQLQIETPWGQSNHEKKIADGTNLGTLATGTPARLELPQGQPMSLVFQSDQAPTIFYGEWAPLHIGSERQLLGPESYRLNLSGTAADPREAQLPAGNYRVFATRGPEYDVTEASFELAAGRVTPLDIQAPSRVVKTPGLVGVDFHVHTGVSFDSSLLPQQQVINFVAHGGEVIVPTEHSIGYDLNPVIAAMGLADQIVSFPGVEITGMAQSAITPSTIGHSNVFPIEVDHDEFMGGTLQFEGKRLGHVIAAYKARFPNSIFQLNHPRTKAYDDDITFFNHLSQGVAFDPAIPLEEGNNVLLIEQLEGTPFRDIDFDAIELLNGESMDVYEIVRTDWFALIKQNIYKVATANSDSHVGSQLVAYPRSYLEVLDDDISSIKVKDIVAATKKGALYGSTGPIINVRLGDTGPGGTFSGGKGVLTISLEQAPWITANEARIWLNGNLWHSLPISSTEDIKVDVDVSADSFLFVEVLGAASETYAEILPNFRPFAFANPIFIDVAGNGWVFDEKPK